MKPLAALFLSMALSACVMDSPAVHRDDTAKVRLIAEERGKRDLACPSAKYGRSIQSVRMTDWGEPLFTEYRTFVEGCGKHITYIVACHDDEECVFADTLSIYPE